MIQPKEFRHDWRGVIEQLVYPVKPGSKITDHFVEQVADSILNRRGLVLGPTLYRHACEEALANQELAENQVLTDYLRRLAQVLDSRRPWPSERFSILAEELSDFAGAPIVGVILVSKRDVENIIGAKFRSNANVDDENVRTLSVRLLGRHDVTFVAERPFSEPRVAVRAQAEPSLIAEALERSTGFILQ